MAKLISLLFVSVLLVGCATPYQRAGFRGGYYEIQLGENIFQVSFNGNAYIGSGRVADFALLRSAEVTIENGFRYFIIVESENYSYESAYTTPRRSSTRGSVYGFGDMAHISATTTTYGGHTYTITKPSTTNTIVCFKEKPEIAALVFDAEFIKKSLRQAYGIKK